MPHLCYREWFAEIANDPHASFAPVLLTYRAEANNGTTQAELNAQWAEDEDHNPLLGFDEENRHYVVLAGRRVPRSAGGNASRHAGLVIAQCGDVAAGATGMTAPPRRRSAEQPHGSIVTVKTQASSRPSGHRARVIFRVPP